MISELLRSCVCFGKRIVGIITTPYVTVRTIVLSPRIFDSVAILLICFCYFLFVSLIKIPAFHFYLLTKEVLLLSVGVTVGVVLCIGTIALVASFLHKKVILLGLISGWMYSLIPTVLWFLLTSLLFILFPPPRTETIQGVSFSLLYLLISCVLLGWKIELYYLTLRFSLKMSLKHIIVVSSVLLPVIVCYSYFMYKVSVFRVPFV